jgi:hypothetical protein
VRDRGRWQRDGSRSAAITARARLGWGCGGTSDGRYITSGKQHTALTECLKEKEHLMEIQAALQKVGLLPPASAD